MEKNEKTVSTVNKKRNETKSQNQIRRAARARKKAAQAKREVEKKECRYYLSAIYDDNLMTEVKEKLLENKYTPQLITDGYVCIRNLTKEDVEKIRDLLKDIHFTYHTKKIDKATGKVREIVKKQLKVHWVSAYKDGHKETLFGPKRERTRKPSANTTEVKIAAHNARKEANIQANPKGVAKEDKQTKRISILNRGTHSSGTKAHFVKRIKKSTSISVKLHRNITEQAA